MSDDSMTESSGSNEHGGPLDTDTMTRLALARYVFGLAVEQSRQPEPLCTVSILTFHDSVELFLRLAAEFRNVDLKPNIDFIGYWDALRKAEPPVQFSRKGAMQSLNQARINLKHYGNETTPTTIERHRVHVTEFFEENTPKIFGIPWNAISMTFLVQCQLAREGLDAAVTQTEHGNFDLALTAVAYAFYYLIDDYERRDGSRGERSPYDFVASLNASMPSRTLVMNDLDGAVRRLEGAMAVLALGLDLARYVRFRMTTPWVGKTRDGESQILKDGLWRHYARDDVRFCIDFVIEAALKLQRSPFVQ